MVEYIKKIIFGRPGDVEESKVKSRSERIRENLERVENKKREARGVQEKMVFPHIMKVEPRKYEREKYIKVCTEEQMAEMCQVIQECKMIGVDLENHHVKSYNGYLCLMQITTVKNSGDT